MSEQYKDSKENSFENIGLLISQLQIEDLPRDDDSINGVHTIQRLLIGACSELQAASTSTRSEVYNRVINFSQRKQERLVALDAKGTYLLPHAVDWFMDLKQSFETSLGHPDIEQRQPFTERDWQSMAAERSRRDFLKKLGIGFGGILAGSLVENRWKPVSRIADWLGFRSGLEKKIIDTNKLTSLEESQIFDILKNNYTNIQKLYRYYKQDIADAYSEAGERLQEKGAVLGSILEQPNEVFASIIANKLWNHNENRPLTDNELQKSFGEYDVFVVPGDKTDTHYAQLYHPDYLNYYYQNKAGFTFIDAEKPTFKEILVVSLMFLSDNKNGRMPVAASALFCAEHVYNSLLTE